MMSVCSPCKGNVHRGPSRAAWALVSKEQRDAAGVCPGGNWCDCQCRSDVPRRVELSQPAK